MNPQEFNAIVLCAGLGTRLRPLTSALPKPAVPVGPVPAALRNIEQLLTLGLPVVHCNTHYLASELEKELLAACQSRGIPNHRLRFWNEPELLETGGGIARIAKTLASEGNQKGCKDTLVVSGDIVADIPMARMLERWQTRKSSETALMVTLPLDKPRKDVTWVAEASHSVMGFGADCDPQAAADRGYSPRVFSNHQIISGQILERSSIEKKSSIDIFYRQALRQGESIIHVPLEPQAHWFDIGTPQTYMHCISKLDHDLPLHLAQLGSTLINLCGVDQPAGDHPVQTLDTARHDQSCTPKMTVAEICLSKISPTSTTHWLWMGSLYSVPSGFHDGLSNLILRSSRAPAGRSTHGAGLPSQALSLHPLQGGLKRLLGHSSLPLPDSRLHSSDTVGLIDAPLPESLASHPLFVSPVLVPLDLLLRTDALSEPTSPDTLSPFWILFIQPRP